MKIIGNTKAVGVALLALGAVFILVGGIFIQQSVAVKAQLLDAIKAQRISSSGVQEQVVIDDQALYNPPTTVTPPTGTAPAVTKPVYVTTTVVPATGTTPAVTKTVPIVPGTIVPVDAKIDGIIDTPQEVNLMADTLMAHLISGYAPYSAMSGTDPNRTTLLNALTMITALNLARMGFGVSTIALGNGLFMIGTGLGFDLLGAYLWRRKESASLVLKAQ